jgi:hypothetical protein
MKKKVFTLGALVVLKGQAAYACAACFGQSDSPLAEGMNMGILCLLGVLSVVLAGVVAFFVHACRKGAAVEQGATSVESPPTGH